LVIPFVCDGFLFWFIEVRVYFADNMPDNDLLALLSEIGIGVCLSVGVDEIGRLPMFGQSFQVVKDNFAVQTGKHFFVGKSDISLVVGHFSAPFILPLLIEA
jgi:hypothetical protein